MASRSKKARKLAGSVGIFRLPEEILQKIFFFLTVEDAVSLSVTSKTWRNLWKSLPVLKLSFQNDENVPLENFVASIEDSLSTLRSRSAIIETFLLTINQPQKEGLMINNLESHLHDWLSLIMRNYVKEIDFRVSESPDNNSIFYTVPQSVFTSRSLVKLHLIGCRFPTNISFTDNNDDKIKSRFHHEFLCLKEITLEDVIARSDQIQDLVDHSKNFLEKLTIKAFHPIEFLTLKFFSKLNFLEVNVMTLHVDLSLNLDTVVLYGIQKVLAFGTWNIKTLRCLVWNTSAYIWIKKLISNLPLLETLQLSMGRNENIEIRSLNLKTLFVCECQRFVEPIVVEIDAPRLSKIYFTGFSFPMMTMLRRSQRVELHHFGHRSRGLDSSQLYRLGKFSQNVIHPVLEIHLHQIFIQNLLTLEELKEHPVVFHPTNVTMVVLECIPAASNYSSFLDALFWTCHPTRLLVLMNKEETLKSSHRASFISYLVDELIVKRENNPTCCPQHNRPKCWRHYIAEVRLQLYRSMHVFEAEDLKDMPVELAENGTLSVVETNNKGLVVQFRLLWLPYPT